MPEYTYQDPFSGVSITLQGETEPPQDVLEYYFKPHIEKKKAEIKSQMATMRAKGVGLDAVTASLGAAETGLGAVQKGVGYIGNVAKAIPADVAETVAGNEKYYELKNLAGAALGEEPQITQKIADASSESPTASTVAKVGQGLLIGNCFSCALIYLTLRGYTFAEISVGIACAPGRWPTRLPYATPLKNSGEKSVHISSRREIRAILRQRRPGRRRHAPEW